MDDTELIDLEVDLTGLGFLDSLADFHRDGAGLGVGHQATGTEDATKSTNLGHAAGHGDDDIDVSPTTLNLGDILIKTVVVGTGGFGLFLLVGGAEHEDADGLTRAVRQGHAAANHLVGLAGVNTQTHIDIDGRVELREGDFLHNADSLFERIHFATVKFGDSFFLFFCQFCHVGLFLWSTHVRLRYWCYHCS